MLGRFALLALLANLIFGLSHANKSFAESKYEVSLSADQISILAITASNPISNIQIFRDKQLVSVYEIQHQHIQRDVVVFGPFDTLEHLTLVSKQAISFSPLASVPVAEIERFVEAKRILERLNALYSGESIQWLSQAIEEKWIEPTMHNAVLVDFIYYLLENRQTQAAMTLLKSSQIDLDQKIVIQCYSLERALNEKITSQANLNIGIADLGKMLLDRHLHIGKLDETPSIHSLSKKIYFNACTKIIEHIDKTNNQTTNSSDSADWTLIQESKKLLNHAVYAAHQLDDPLSLAQVLNRSWYLHNATPFENGKAELVSRQALYLASSIPNQQDLIASLIMQNNTILKRIGRYPENRIQLARGLAMLNELSSENADLMLFSAGFLYRELGEFDLALRYFKRSIERYKTSPEDSKEKQCKFTYRTASLVGKALVQIGYIYRLKEKYSLAKQYVDCAIGYLEKEQENYLVVGQIERARLLVIVGELEKAKLILTEKILKRTLYPAQELDAYLILFEIELQRSALSGSRKSADILAKKLGVESFFSENLTADNFLAYPIVQLEAFSLLIRYAQLKNDPELVERFYFLAQKISQNNRAKVTQPQAWNAARFSLASNYIEAISTFSKTDDNLPSLIFNALETLYSLDTTREKNLYNLENDENESSSRIQLDFNKWMTAEQNLLHASVNNRHQLQRQVDLSKTHFFAHSPNVNKMESYSKDVASLAYYQQKMSSQEIVLRLYVGPKQSFALEFTKNKARLRAIPSQKIIEAVTHDLLSDSGVLNWQKFKSSKILSDLLPVDWINTQQFKKLIITPDSTLHRLPFAAVNIGNDSYQPLVSQISVVRTYSTSNYYDDKLSYNDNSDAIAIFSPSDSDTLGTSSSNPNKAITRNWPSKFSSLFGASREAAFIADMFKGQTLLLGTNQRGTADFLFSDATKNAKLLHIATHGIYLPDYPDNSGLLVARSENNDNLVTMNQLLGQPYESRLIVISGCNTMLGQNYRGSGIRSLARGFLAQGAGSVLGTLWAVPDKSTEKLMKFFYSKLKENGGATIDALTYAQHKMLRSGRYKHPKYWAGFALTLTNRKYETLNL